MQIDKDTEDNLLGLIGELLLAGQGDSINFVCNWYLKYSDRLSHRALKMILVGQGFLPNPLGDITRLFDERRN